jgi:hypothetical protein
LLGVFPLVGERGRRRWRQSSGFLFEGAEEVIEVGGDIVGLEVQMKMLLNAGEWIRRGQEIYFVDGNAKDRDEGGEAGFIVNLCFDLVGGSASDA